MQITPVGSVGRTISGNDIPTSRSPIKGNYPVVVVKEEYCSVEGRCSTKNETSPPKEEHQYGVPIMVELSKKDQNLLTAGDVRTNALGVPLDARYELRELTNVPHTK